MLRWLRRNLDTLILSIILAIFVWYAATTEEANPTSRRFPAPGSGIPIEVRNLGPSLTLEEEIEQQVSLTLAGPQRELDDLRLNDFRAWVELEGLGGGAHEPRVQVQCQVCQRRFIQILDYEPRQISVRLEVHLEKTFTVRPDASGEPAAGYQAGIPDLSPREVTVSGPASQVEKVDGVLAPFSVADLRHTLEQTVRLQPIDEQGLPVSGVRLSPAEARVRVAVEQKRGYKDVAVRAVLSGQVGEGYWVSNISVEPSVLTIFGDPDVVDSVGGFVETEPIDISGAAEAVALRARLQLPPGVQLLDVRTVRVVVDVEPLQGGTSLQVVVGFVGLGPGLVATASPETVQVFLSGPLPVLQELAQDPDRLQAIIDLSELGPGTYILRPEIRGPEELRVSSLLPSRAEVEIEEASGGG